MVSAMGPRALNSKEVFEEIAQRFREELDYVHEAEQQMWFRALHEGDPAIRIPAIVPERCGQRVLTSELVQNGHDLAWAVAQDETRRRHVAQTLWRFVFKGNLVGGRFNADPHPGNYLFHDDGTISFVDFGCIHPIDQTHLREARAMHRAACDRDEASFATHTAALLELQPGAYRDAMVAYARECFEPLFTSPYRVTREYVRGLVSGMAEMKWHIIKRDSGFTRIPPGIVWMNRLQFGFYSVLAQLDVAADYARIERDVMHQADATRDA
jgi:predicted unusual protein kinase regulating ubiquinone biosynthesis (AarF/ABC1/UbiB family)